MDDYDVCLAEPGGKYCLLVAELYSKDQSELMQMIQDYSEDKIKHYNHSLVHRAVCVTKTCKEFTQNRSIENEGDLRSALEECIDSYMWREYELNARLTDIHYCKNHGEERPYGAGDYAVACVYLILIILNAIGTSYDVLKGYTAGNPYLLAFSVRKNWRKLTAPSGKGTDPRLNRLQVFNGIRTLTTFCVYLGHVAVMCCASYLKNTYYMETSYEEFSKYILFNGTLVVYTFFVMAGFMLAFNMELKAEKHRLSLWDWPKGMLLRWLRLTPTLALVMFTVMTINRHLGDGPQWDLIVTSEADACSQYWWAHLLYVNNYIYGDSHCFPQSWYLAADTQLYGLGLLMCILFRKPRSQVPALAVMLVVALAIPAALVYFQDLGAVVYQSPESLRTFYHSDDPYRLIYIRGHTNIATYVLGVAGGLLTYHWFKNEKRVSQRLQKYAWIVWLSLPLCVGTLLSGGLFYMDYFEPSTLVKVLYAAVHKPFFQLCSLIIIIGCIFKVENVYRGILEWRGFSWTARVSYSGFLLHTIFQRDLVGLQRLPTNMSLFHIATVLSATIFFALTVGALLFVTVESPIATIIKVILMPRKDDSSENAVSVTTKV